MPFHIASYFQRSRDTAARLAAFFQLPNCESFFVIKREARQPTTYIEVQPLPVIRNLNERLIDTYSKLEGVQFETDDKELFISGAYMRSEVIGRGISYLIGATLSEIEGDGNDEITGGIEYDLVPGTNIEQRSLEWKLLLRRRSSVENTTLLATPAVLQPRQVPGLIPSSSIPFSWIATRIDSSDIITKIDLENIDYYYYGGLQLDGDWRINRFDKVMLFKQYASIENNPSYSSLVTAWNNRTDLTYQEVD